MINENPHLAFLLGMSVRGEQVWISDGRFLAKSRLDSGWRNEAE